MTFPDQPRPRKLRRNSILRFAAILSLSLGATAGLSQDSPSSLPAQMENSLGMQFKKIAETPILFCLHETRRGDFEAFVAATGHEWKNDLHFTQKANEPAVNINLADAQAFCQWLTQKEREEGKISSNQLYRLPSNQEWSVVAGLGSSTVMGANIDERLAQERLYPWGEEWPPPVAAANLSSNDIDGYQDDFRFTSPAGAFKPNEKGFYDLAGNAWEWCEDSSSDSPLNGTLRGGSWIYFRPEFLRSAFQYEVPKTLRAATFGFRCVFEDTVISAAVNKATDQERASLVAQRSESLVGSSEDRAKGADSSSVEEARNRLLPGREDDTAGAGAMMTIKPPTLATAHKNSIGLSFLPVSQQTLMGTTEVRRQDFEAFIRANGSDWPGKPSFGQTGGHPAVGVTWDEATAFCVWLTNTERQNGSLAANQIYRLPTDAEWSLAAGIAGEAGNSPQEKSNGAVAIYPWGDAWPPSPGSTNVDSSKIDDFRDRHSYTCSVTDTEPNGNGFHGLGGNASEWCQDVWPEQGRVIRGGSWLDSDPLVLRAGNRKALDQAKSRTDVGFRLIITVQ